MPRSRSTGKPRVIYRLNSPAPYAVERFNIIHRRGNIDLEAWFDFERASDRSWDVRTSDWAFPSQYVDPQPISISLRVRKAAPDVYFSLYENLSFASGVLAARSVGAKTVLRVLKTFDTWRKRSFRTEAAKHIMFRLVDAIHTTGPDGEDYARKYGAKRIIKFAEPIDVLRFKVGAAATRQRPESRAEWGLQGCVFLYVGRLWKGKGIDYLLEAFRQLREEMPDCSLLVVGDGIDEEHYRLLAKSIPGIVFTGFVQQSNLPHYYGLSDVLVFPTLGDPYGHVVHEAMASCLSVISTQSAGDIGDRVIEGKTGFIVPPASSEGLLDKMRVLAADTFLRHQMARNGFALVETRTNEWWAAEYERMVYELLEMPVARDLNGYATRHISETSTAGTLKGMG